MSRSARSILPLLRSLLLGAATASSMALSAGIVAGCADENDPETHVKRLDDPATLPQAVNRLVQFFEDAMTRDNKDRSGPTVKPLLDQIVEPMTQKCVAGDLDERTNSKLIKFLSDTRDPRGSACLIKALKDYKADSTEEDVRWAVRGLAATKPKDAAGPLLDVFTKLQHAKPKGSTISRDVHDAMLEINDPSWEGQLITMLGRPINDPKDVATLRNELFWQITAAELLGWQRSEKAVVPLLKVVLSPLKADAAATAILALTKIGKPAIEPTIALLKGEHKELVEYSQVESLKTAGDKPNAEQKKAAETAHVAAAALVLATIGRQESVQPLLAALEKAEDVPRAIIARELTKVPKTPETLAAFQAAYEKTPASLQVPPAGVNARAMLAEAAGNFFDASLVPWLVKAALSTRGEEDDVAQIRDVSLLTALKLMKADQIAEVDRLANTRSSSGTVGKAFEKEIKLAKGLLKDCGDKAACYVGKLGEPASQAKDTQFQGIKAAYMTGVLGTPDVRQSIIDAMPKISNAAVRFVSVSVIDALSPKGDADVATKLQKIVDDGEASKDAAKISANAPFKTVIYRLNARAQ
ncbi:hypothetical protein SOCEGT47_007650 [Sorangium cellulosum]|uniref:Secreted protein n=1 Tax=Sorangium cellulosum TaxID=56 RepID=A0A4P2PUE3_SORCE|nr:hypothetical protein [Sorangium cellulosum]AUX20297.1 hypothetical protein SOCEGT47_007650 [Sorangium cellulosum]